MSATVAQRKGSLDESLLRLTIALPTALALVGQSETPDPVDCDLLFEAIVPGRPDRAFASLLM